MTAMRKRTGLGLATVLIFTAGFFFLVNLVRNYKSRIHDLEFEKFTLDLGLKRRIRELEKLTHESESQRRISELYRSGHNAAESNTVHGGNPKGLHARRERWHHARTGHRTERDEHIGRKVPRITLLYWTQFFGEDNVFVNEEIVCGEGKGEFVVSLSHDRSVLPKAAAVIFHARGITDLPERQVNQKWIIDTQESPVHDAEATGGQLQDYQRMRQFDYLMSYHQGADFFHPMVLYDNFTEVVLQKSSVPFEEKTGNVLFLASNCKSYNDREAYINELAKHTKVDMRGNCMNNAPAMPPGDEADKEMHKYKFILAFENSCCEDYISEKLVNAFRAGAVPVVAGPLDYSTYEPSNRSLINIRDFPTVAALGAYLNRIGSDKKLYEEYMAYKEDPSLLSVRFRDIWSGRQAWSVFCEVGEEMLSYTSPSKYQGGRAVLPIDMGECEPEGNLRTMFVTNDSRTMF